MTRLVNLALLMGFFFFGTIHGSGLQNDNDKAKISIQGASLKYKIEWKINLATIYIDFNKNLINKQIYTNLIVIQI